MFGYTPARNVKRGPMIDRGANERQAQSHVNRLTKRKALDGDHRLVMIARDHDVELAARGPQENRVSRKGSADIDIIRDMATLNGRQDFRGLFNSEESPFRAMRVQGGDRNSRLSYSPTLQFVMRQPDRFLQAFAPD